jgi:DNA-directed RNA polymerase
MKEEKIISNLNDVVLSQIINLGPVGTKILRAMETEVALTIRNTVGRPFTWLKLIQKSNMDLRVIIQLSHIMLATGSQEGQGLTKLARALGDKVMKHFRLPINAANANHLGIFILNAYSEVDLISIKLIQENSSNGIIKNKYKVYAKNRSELLKLVEEFKETYDRMKPLKRQANNWENGMSKDIYGADLKLIKNAKLEVLKDINNYSTPIVLNAINKKQSIGYKICQDTFKVYEWALDNNENAFEHNYNQMINLERKKAKRLEAEFIRVTAKEQKGIFYQRYTTDARGRIYPEAGFLNEICSDNAKGLIQFAEGMKFGVNGKEEFFHHISNMFGEDKLPHEGRVKFVKDNYETFCSYGYEPTVNKGWMKAAEPFQFLQAVIELAKFDVWIKNGYNEQEFVSHVICYRDGSNNGLQWLFSLAKDDLNAHLVNIKPTEDGKPGDFYKHVALSVMKHINEMPVSEEDKTLFFTIWMRLNKLRNKLIKTESNIDRFLKLKTKSRLIKKHLKRLEEIREKRLDIIKKYQKENRKELQKTDVTYWKNAEKIGGFNSTIWRQIVKRPSMTYGYSATKQGMGSQIIEDTKDIDNQYLNNKNWSAARLLGSLIHEAIENEFPNVKSIMDFFKDNCSKYIEKNKKQYMHKTIISNFPMIQKYVKYKSVPFKINKLLVTEKDGTKIYHNDVKTKILHELPIIDKAKSRAGISPNTIHNLDALHLMLVIDEAKFPIVSAHDSYGAHACNIVIMQRIIREQFLRIIEADPIKHILDQTGNLVEYPKTGDLNPKDILKSEYAFA